MKILIFTSQFIVGAAERLGAELAVDLNHEGIHAEVMSLYSANQDGARKAEKELLARGVPGVHYLGLPLNPTPAGLLVAMRRFNKILRRQKFDIVETSSLTPGIIAVWGRLGSHTRHVVGLHYSFSETSAAPKSIKLFQPSMRLRKDTRFYAVSTYVKNAWIQFSKIPADRTRVIYNCISLLLEDGPDDRNKVRRELGIPDSSSVLLCAGRIAPYKLQDVVLEALRIGVPERDLILLFAGEPDRHITGTQEMLARMEEVVTKEGLATKVHFLGYRSDLSALMRASDLLVHATEKEAFGLVLVEALAVGLPVIATNVEGIPEVLDGTDSMLIPPRDPLALCRAIQEMLDRDENASRQAIQKGKEKARRFQQPERTAKMVEYFEDILAGRA